MTILFQNKSAIFMIYIIIAFQTIQSAQCQNSLTGDGFGGRQWYNAHNYQVGAYTGYTVCGADSQLYAWGGNVWGELATASTVSTVTAVSIPNMNHIKFYTTGYLNGIIKNDGSAWVWGFGYFNTGFNRTPVQILNNVKFIDAGQSHVVFVKNDGSVWGVGRNDYGALGNGIVSSTPTTSPVQFVGINNAVRAIACGSNADAATVILLNDGTVKVTGGGGIFQAINTTVPVIVPGLNNIVDIKGNALGVYALDINGSVFSFGNDNYNSYSYGLLGLSNIPAGYSQPTEIVFPPNAKPIVALSTNNDGQSILALDSIHQVYAWGRNEQGNLGTNDTLNKFTPVLVATNCIDIYAGETFTYILKSDNSLFASGTSGYPDNLYGFQYGSIWMNLPNIKRNTFTQINPLIAPMNLCNPIPFGCTGPNVWLGNDTTLCIGSQLTITAPSSSNYLWSTGATTQSITVSSSGQYWVSAGNNSCNSSDTINVTFSTTLINLGNDTTLCQGQSMLLTGGNASSYIWSTGATTQTINVSSSGQYWVKASNGNCFKTDTINISFTLLPTVSLGSDTTLCQDQSLQLNAGAASTYLWSTDATSQTINVTMPGQYWVKISNGSCFKADTIMVAYKFPPAILFPPDTTLCNDQILILDAGNALKYLWSTGETSQIIKVSQSGNYSVNINYYSTCQKQLSIIAKFESCDCALLMPTAFTPNSDGLNDIFKPAKKSGCQFLKFSIFNRYGEMVFQTSDLNNGWDGKFKGIQQDIGMFVWMVTAIIDGQNKVFKGTVTLIR